MSSVSSPHPPMGCKGRESLSRLAAGTKRRIIFQTSGERALQVFHRANSVSGTICTTAVQREIRVNNIRRSEALTPHDTATPTRTYSLRYHLKLSPSFHLVHYSQTLSHLNFIPSFSYNVFIAAPIVAYKT